MLYKKLVIDAIILLSAFIQQHATVVLLPSLLPIDKARVQFVYFLEAHVKSSDTLQLDELNVFSLVILHVFSVSCVALQKGDGRPGSLVSSSFGDAMYLTHCSDTFVGYGYVHGFWNTFLC